MFHLLQLFDEFALQVNILIFKFALLIGIQGDVIIEFIHFLLESLEVDSYLCDFPFEVCIAVIETLLFLLHNRLLV